MNTPYINDSHISLDKFATLCAQTLRKGDFPLARSADKNVPIYHHDDLLAAARADRQTMLGELHHALSGGPGVFVVQGLYRDLSAIDSSNKVFDDILVSEAANGGGGDHFAKAGSNGRIWNALQKVAERDADAFVDYYSNPLLALICEAWVGPGYEITAQVNQVRPGGKAQQPHRDYHLGFQLNEVVARFPLPLQILSQYLTLQGAVAHSDMPVESGPTQLLPWSQQYAEGYLAWRDPRFIEFFQQHAIQLPLKKGDGFDLNDFLAQLKQMRNMGGMAGMLTKLPGMSQVPDAVKSQMDDSVLTKMEAMINSMTKKERVKPEIIKGSRKRRIAAGSGTQVQDVNRLLKQFDDMQRMMKKMKKGGLAKMMRGMKGMMPPGMMGR